MCPAGPQPPGPRTGGEHRTCSGMVVRNAGSWALICAEVTEHRVWGAGRGARWPREWASRVRVPLPGPLSGWVLSPPPIFPADPAAEEGPRVPEMHIRGHQPLSVAALSRGGLCQVLVGLGQAELPQVGVAGGGGWGPPGTSALAARSQVGFAVLRDHPVTCAGTGWHPVH